MPWSLQSLSSRSISQPSTQHDRITSLVLQWQHNQLATKRAPMASSKTVLQKHQSHDQFSLVAHSDGSCSSSEIMKSDHLWRLRGGGGCHRKYHTKTSAAIKIFHRRNNNAMSIEILNGWHKNGFDAKCNRKIKLVYMNAIKKKQTGLHTRNRKKQIGLHECMISIPALFGKDTLQSDESAPIMVCAHQWPPPTALR